MMPPPLRRRFRLILAGVDFSAVSAHAVRYAAATARRCGGRLVVMHVIDPLLTAAAAHAYAEQPLIGDTKHELDRFVRRAIGPAAADGVECAVVVGAARQSIVGEARRRHADVVVLGTNGRGGIPKVFFGSTTLGLLRRYRGAVMVVPPRCGHPALDWPGGSIVAAVAQGPHHRAMMSVAVRTAEIFGGGLTVVSSEPSGNRRHEASLIVLPVPGAARLQTFTQGARAYEFIRRSGVPVLVMHTGRGIGHLEGPKRRQVPGRYAGELRGNGPRQPSTRAANRPMTGCATAAKSV
jgi:nucleotide-binding universal stress UspA family protein